MRLTVTKRYAILYITVETATKRNDLMKTTKQFKQFTRESEAERFWKTEADKLRKAGKRVVKNELIYNKDGTFTVEIETK